jgi:mannitol/fructose-specific phosphotransferase system IIA component (Ntr-type)
VLGFSLGLSLLAASFTEAIGVHAVLGSFLLGVVIGDSSHLRERTRTVIDHFISFIFAPLFFAMIGLRINFLTNFDLPLLLLMLLLACAGKLIGCGFGARLSGMSRRESWALGFAMNARGSMEIVLGTLALESGIISERVFEALVLVALATAIVPGPAMQFILKRRRPIKATDFLAARTFVGRLSASNRIQAIREMSESVAAVLGLEPRAVADAVWQREETMATGLGHGVAIPHARIASAERAVVAVGLSTQGLDFDAPDGAPVHLVFMVVTPAQDNGVQLQILADVSRTCMRPAFMERASGVDNYTEFLALLNTSVGEL